MSMTKNSISQSAQTYAPPPTPIDFTENAARKVHELITEEENPDLKLRVFITGGGCSGLQYGFTFDEETKEGDTTITTSIAITNAEDNPQQIEVHLLVDPMSFQYLVGAKIDYVEDLQGAQFVIHNPNAQTTCGCGSSFTVEDDDD